MPKIELMMSDLPHTLYKHNTGKSENGNTFSQADVDEATRLFEEAQKRKKAMQHDEGVTIENLFNGDADE